MEDKADEETLDKQTNDEYENLSEEIIFPNHIEIITTKQGIENMEVHHHPNLEHKPKKWKEYFLEFLMIFLAVTLGFISENIREHITNRAKEKQYISGFIQNLKDDTASLNHVIEFDKLQLIGIDSMLKLSHINMTIDSNRKSFYHFVISYCYGSSSFTSNDATLQQLKSTGEFRLIEKDDVAESLTKYDTDIHSIYSQGDFYKAYFKEILSRLDELTDVTILLDTSFLKNGKAANMQIPQLRAENGKLTTFFNKVYIFSKITHAYAEDNLKPQLENAKKLIAFLQEKYDIKK